MKEGIETYLSYALLYVFGIGIFILIQSNMPTTENMSAWTFTGASFVASLFPVLPWLFLIAMLTVPTYYIFREFG